MDDPYETMGLIQDIDDDLEVKRKFLEVQERLYYKFMASDNKMEVKREIDNLQKAYSQLRNENTRFAFQIIKSALESLSGSLAVFEAKQMYDPSPITLKKLIRKWARGLKSAPLFLAYNVMLEEHMYFGRVNYVFFDYRVTIKAQTNIQIRNAEHPVSEQLSSSLNLRATFVRYINERDFKTAFTAPPEAAQALIPLMTRMIEKLSRDHTTLSQERMEVSYQGIVICEKQMAQIQNKLMRGYSAAQWRLQARLFSENEVEQCALADIGGKITPYEDDVVIVACPCVVFQYHYQDQTYWAFVNLHTGSMCGKYPQSRAKVFFKNLLSFKLY